MTRFPPSRKPRKKTSPRARGYIRGVDRARKSRNAAQLHHQGARTTSSRGMEGDALWNGLCNIHPFGSLKFPFVFRAGKACRARVKEESRIWFLWNYLEGGGSVIGGG